MEKNIKVFLDLTEYSSKYQGGVSTFAIGITKGLVELQNKNIELYILVDDANDIRKLMENWTNHVSIIEINRKMRKKITKVLHRINYNLTKSYIFFKCIKNMEFSRGVRRIVRNEIVYCPTTYLNFSNDRMISIVSLHDCQEKTFPENFSKKQLLYRKFQAEYTLRESNAIQVSTSFVASELRRHFAELFAKDEKSSIIVEIPEGVDTSFFKPTKQVIERETKEILVPSSFLPHKNHDELFRALAILDGQCSFVVYLTGEGVNREKYIKLASSFTTIRCEFIGYIEKEMLLELYQRVNLVVICSMYESSSLPIFESLACNTHVLVSDIAPHVELKEKYGLQFAMYHLSDEEDLANKMLSCLEGANDREIQSKISQFDWRNLAQDYLKLFLKVSANVIHSCQNAS